MSSAGLLPEYRWRVEVPLPELTWHELQEMETIEGMTGNNVVSRRPDNRDSSEDTIRVTTSVGVFA